MPFSTRGTGRYQASLDDCFYLPRNYTPGSRRGVLMFAGLNGTADTWYGTTLNALSTPNAIIAYGTPTASIAVDALWGNSAFRTRVSNMKTYAQTTTGIFASGKVHVVGSSMGGCCALNWAFNNPTLVQSLSLTIPAVDPQDINTNNRSGLAAGIQTAFGGAPSDADTPAKNASSFTGIPMKIWYSDTDPICIPALTTAFAATAGASIVDMGSLGHAVSGAEIDGIAAFIAAHD